MIRHCSWLALLTLLGSAIKADEPTNAAVVQQSAQKLADAFMKGDYARVIDQTHPAIVKFMGGRAKALEATESEMKSMKAQGVTVKAYDVSKPGEFLRDGTETYVVVPTSMEATTPGARVIMKSYLLGISSNNGKSWTFADGTGLGNRELREAVLPKLPAGLKLPELEKPQIFKD